MGSCVSRGSKSAQTGLVDERVVGLSKRVKPAILPIWRDEDILTQVVIPYCPSVVFFSGREYNNKFIEKKIREYQDRYVFTAFRCCEYFPSTLAFTIGSVPCVVLHADWVERDDRRCIVHLDKSDEVNAQLLDDLFRLFEEGNRSRPKWWIVTEDEQEADQLSKSQENYCLLVKSTGPVVSVSQPICTELCSYSGKLKVVLYKGLPSDEKGEISMAVLLCQNGTNKVMRMDNSNQENFIEFVRQVRLYMSKYRREESKKDIDISANRVKIDASSAFVESVDPAPNTPKSEYDKWILETGLYVKPNAIGTLKGTRMTKV